eukprot:427314-Lingulodinium_polyedra.AAC.1
MGKPEEGPPGPAQQPQEAERRGRAGRARRPGRRGQFERKGSEVPGWQRPGPIMRMRRRTGA